MFRFALAGLLALAPAAAMAQSASGGFCGTYLEMSSSDGNCPGCILQFVGTGGATGYLLSSNTGWSAELTQVDMGEGGGSGVAVWGNVGGTREGQMYNIAVERQGEMLLTLLTPQDPNLDDVVQATYFCAD